MTHKVNLTLSTVNHKKLEGIKFVANLGNCAIFVKLYLAIAKISLTSIHTVLVILDEFAKLSSVKLIYWQICQTLIPVIFNHLRYHI